MPNLVRYDSARRALAEAHRVDEVKDIRDKAAAMAAYARQARDRDMIAWATEIKVRAERRCGELLKRSADSGERATAGGDGRNQHGAPSQSATTLSDIGLTRSQSSRYQKLAGMSDEHFEAAVATAKDAVGEVTTAFMIRQAAPRDVTPARDDREADDETPVVVQERPQHSPEFIANRLIDAVDLLSTASVSPRQVFESLPAFQHYRITDAADRAASFLEQLRIEAKRWAKQA